MRPTHRAASVWALDAGEKLHHDPVSWFITGQNSGGWVHLAVKECVSHRIDDYN